MISYLGILGNDGAGPQAVYRNDALLDPKPSQKLYNHSPDGFNWGYEGSGPAQLALALLLDATGDTNIALSYHQSFKRDVVAKWGKRWHITDKDIKTWLKTAG